MAICDYEVRGSNKDKKSVIQLRSSDETSLEAILALNNDFAKETSLLEKDKLASMMDRAFYAKAIEPAAAFLICYDQDSDHDSLRFAWFKERLAKFAYIDRIVVSGVHQKKGYAKALYEDFFDEARAAGHDYATCEVNFTPPNPGSDAFHAALGFVELGKSYPNEEGKVVTYLIKKL